MNTILVVGAGKSSGNLINYLLANASQNKWKVIVADGNAKAIHEKTGNSPFAVSAVADITNQGEREALVKQADIVVSLMPADLHLMLAKDCLQHKKNLITSSYVSEEMREMDAAVKSAGLMFMCEMGLDPGIDHMTASKIIHGIQRVSGIVSGFKSYCGGLVAPESDNNPWHYKISWNPRNVVNAGKGGATFLNHGKTTEVPYEKLFEQGKKVKINNVGNLAFYPNRDSMRYLAAYDVPEVQSFMRATLRHSNFLKGWHDVVSLGLTNDADEMDTTGMTHLSWVKTKTGFAEGGNFEQFIASKLQAEDQDKGLSLLQWLGLFLDTPLAQGMYSSADILLNLIQEKWKMDADDKDLVVMQHEIEYLHRGRKVKVTSAMSLKGESREKTAMAKTVGLPIGILARLVIKKKIVHPKGVLIPTMASVYRPILTELAHHGIYFEEVIE